MSSALDTQVSKVVKAHGQRLRAAGRALAPQRDERLGELVGVEFKALDDLLAECFELLGPSCPPPPYALGPQPTGHVLESLLSD
jgi:hypothetical protein